MAVKKARRCTRAPLRRKFIHHKLKETDEQKVVRNDYKDKKAAVIAQEIKFARLLASKDKVIRDRVLKNLRKWLTVRSQSTFAFTESDFIRLWKGLFYCMWMSDKPLIQEELAESLSKIVHCFKTKDVVLLYTACALKTLGIEWFGIDQYRLDKFCMLVRRIIRQTFEKCKEQSWDIKWIKGFAEILEKLFKDPKICLGFNMHITDLFLEELSKVSDGNLPEDVITELVKPFVEFLIPMDDERRIKFIMRNIFRHLIFQSDVGLDYMEKFQAWRNAGFPAGSIDAMEKVELSSDEEASDHETGKSKEERSTSREGETKQVQGIEKPLDPRAGRVNVELPQIPFNAKDIAALLDQYKFHPSSTTKSRRQLRRLIKEFTELSQDKMPLGVKEIILPDKSKKGMDSKSAAIRLLKFEQQLYSNKPHKKRKRKKNGQFMEEGDNEFSDEELGDFNDDESNVAQVNESKTEKQRKTKHKLDDVDKLMNTHSEMSDDEVEDELVLRKKKLKTKKKVQGDAGEAVKMGAVSNCKKESKNSSVVNKGVDKELKSKGSKSKSTKVLNVFAQIRKKKCKKSKVTGKWNVSDNAPSLDNKTAECNAKPAKDTKPIEPNGNDKQAVWLMPIFTKLENRTQQTQKGKVTTIHNTNSKKRVKIALQHNTAQHTSEYMLQIRKSPAIPFDANKKPPAGVLKASPIPSPINPFYRRAVV